MSGGDSWGHDLGGNLWKGGTLGKRNHSQNTALLSAFPLTQVEEVDEAATMLADFIDCPPDDDKTPPETGS